MKKFAEVVLTLKSNACYIFTGSCCAALVIDLFTDIHIITSSLLWQFLLIALVGSLIQCLAFTGLVFKNVSYLVRSVIFIIPFFLFLTLCAWGFHWFPLEQLNSWMIFIGIFLAVFLGISLFFFLIS